MLRRARGARFFALVEVVGLLAAPLAGARARPAAGRRPRASQVARAAAGHVAGLDGRVAARSSPTGVPLIVGVLVLLAVGWACWWRPPRAARSLGEPRPRAGSAAAGAGSRARAAGRRPGAAAGPGSAPRSCSRSPTRSVALLVVLRARRVEHREADGHGVHQRDQRVVALPAARPVDERRDAQLLLPRPPRPGLADPSCSASRPTPATSSPSALLFGAHRDRGLHVRRDAVGGRRPRARQRRAAARSRPGWSPSALVRRARQPRGVRDVARRRHPPHDYAWFEPSRVIPDTINEFPSFSFLLGDLHAHVLALPFTRARARRSRCRSRSPGPRGDVVWRARRRGARRRARDRRAVRDQLVVVSGRGGPAGRRRSRPGCATRAAPAARLRARLARARAARQRRPDAAVLPELRPGGDAASGCVHSSRAVHRLARRHGADLRRPRLAAGRRVRGARARRAETAGGLLGWGGSRLAFVAARCWRRPTSPASLVLAAALGVGAARRAVAARSTRRSASSGC